MIIKFNNFLNEVADSIERKDLGLNLYFEDEDAYPFAIDVDTKDMIIGSPGSRHIDYDIYDEDDDFSTKYDIIGRFWTNSKIISFWSYPADKEDLDILIDLINKYSNKIIIDNTWRIEIYEGDDENYTYDIIPITEYKKSDKPSEILKKLHLLKGLEKRKYLLSLGYKSKQSKWKKYMKPFESYLFEYTNNFKYWFGESKVVGEDGKPLVVYHGTNKDFECFDEDKQCENFKVSDLGYYFTNAPIATYNSDFVFGSTASEYAFNSQKKGYNDLDGANILPVYLKIENPLYIDAEGWYAETTALDIQHNDIKRWLKQGNYDGIISKYEDKDSDTYSPNIAYVVFNSNQIKSAIGNNGNYTNSDNITEVNKYSNYDCSQIFFYVDDENEVRDFIRNRCNLKLINRDMSLLIAASSVRNNIKIVRMLIDAGADWNYKDRQGDSFLYYLSKKDEEEIIIEYPELYKNYLINDDLEKFDI